MASIYPHEWSRAESSSPRVDNASASRPTSISEYFSELAERYDVQDRQRLSNHASARIPTANRCNDDDDDDDDDPSHLAKLGRSFERSKDLMARLASYERIMADGKHKSSSSKPRPFQHSPLADAWARVQERPPPVRDTGARRPAGYAFWASKTFKPVFTENTFAADDQYAYDAAVRYIGRCYPGLDIHGITDPKDMRILLDLHKIPRAQDVIASFQTFKEQELKKRQPSTIRDEQVRQFRNADQDEPAAAAAKTPAENKARKEHNKALRQIRRELWEKFGAEKADVFRGKPNAGGAVHRQPFSRCNLQMNHRRIRWLLPPRRAGVCSVSAAGGATKSRWNRTLNPRPTTQMGTIRGRERSARTRRSGARACGL
ncbi:hypothetical protein DFJ74DRAFT_186458 [Hyaloraphidium curvatum]|nr:hypothetical protein DFJ74DRAFT_186458 [Hyaloraphidium curvatum]